jgi:macrodomain Ter protein organizer (MatP/YcbG family)
MRTDPDYRFNQRLSSQTWAKAHPGYWRAYRKRHPEKAERNRLLQAIRNRRRRHPLQKKIGEKKIGVISRLVI